MHNFDRFYFNEKSIAVDDYEKNKNNAKTPENKVCLDYGQKLADRFGVTLNGWMEYKFVFTIPEGVPDPRETFMAVNEEDFVKVLKRFPKFFDYIMEKNFPKGYSPDLSLPKEPPKECETLDLDIIGRMY